MQPATREATHGVLRRRGVYHSRISSGVAGGGGLLRHLGRPLRGRGHAGRGAWGEDSDTTGTRHDGPDNDNAPSSGAVHLY